MVAILAIQGDSGIEGYGTNVISCLLEDMSESPINNPSGSLKIF